jgi:hypothetical protein
MTLSSSPKLCARTSSCTACWLHVRRKVVVGREVKAYNEQHIESFQRDKEVALSLIQLP